MSVPVQAAPAGIDDPLAASQADHNVSEARRRRHRSTRRAGSATIRSEQPSSREVPREQQVEEGGEEEEASSVYSSSTVSASARYRRSLKRIREKRPESGTLETDGGGGDEVAQPRPPGRQEGEEERGRQPVVGAPTPDVDGSGLDDTTTRLTSLLQRIEDEPLQDPGENDERGASQPPSPSPPPPQPTLALTVHKTDRLRPDLAVTHPLVRVCLVSCESGELVKKPYPGRRVTSYYEEGVDYILPVLSQPWRKKGHSFQPRWEETLVFNEDISLFTSHQNLLLFELLDLPSPSSHPPPWRNRKQLTSGESWHQIAWAFLRAGGNGTRLEGQQGGGGGSEAAGEMEERRRNIGKVCRLQLFSYPKRRRNDPLSSISEIWELWRSYKKKPYPSTLYVTLNEATPTTRVQATPTTRSMDPCQPEVGRESVEQMMGRLHNHTQRTAEPARKLVDVPARLLGHTCHLPTSLHSHLHPPHTVAGSSVLSFSPDGHYLGVGYTAPAHEDRYTLVVYEVSTLSVVLYSDTHRGFIYSLSWSHDSHMISTASADSLVKVWSIGSGDQARSLPHPCYMYTVCFIPPSLTPPSSTLSSPPPLPPSHLPSLLTGGYDRVIRVWTLTPSRAQLSQELKGHRGHINSMCVGSSGEMMYSGDSVGEVMVWSRDQPDGQPWCLQRAISTAQKSPAPILSLCLHPGGNRLLVHSTTGRLAMIDLRVDRECCSYGVLHPPGYRGSSVVTPCGMLVMGGGGAGEEAEVKVWTCDSGELQHSFSLPQSSVISSLSYHPSLHLMAVSSLSSRHPVSLLTHSQ